MNVEIRLLQKLNPQKIDMLSYSKVTENFACYVKLPMR